MIFKLTKCLDSTKIWNALSAFRIPSSDVTMNPVMFSPNKKKSNRFFFSLKYPPLLNNPPARTFITISIP